MLLLRLPAFVDATKRWPIDRNASGFFVDADGLRAAVEHGEEWSAQEWASRQQPEISGSF
jgi:hypothetical protein